MIKVSDFPESWKVYKIKELGEVVTGTTPSMKQPENYGGSLVWIKPPDLDKGKYVDNSEKKISEIGRAKVRVLPAGSILVSCIGNIGKVAIAGCELCTNQQINSIIPNGDVADSNFLYYLIKRIQPYLEKIASSAVVPLLNKRNFSNVKISLPPIKSQKQIASILEKADQLKQWRKEADKLTDDYLNSTFLKMFGDPIKNPKNWEKVPLGKLSKIRRGASPRPIKDFLGGTVPWIKIGDGTKGNELYIEETEEKIIEEGVHKSVFLKKGALIFANCGVSLRFARILKIDGCIHDGWLSFEEIDQKLKKIFLLKLVNYISDYFRRLAPKGTQPNLNTPIMKKFEIPLPPITLQNKFANIVKEFQQIKDLQNQSKKQVEDLLNVLTQKAFRGELAC